MSETCLADQGAAQQGNGEGEDTVRRGDRGREQKKREQEYGPFHSLAQSQLHGKS